MDSLFTDPDSQRRLTPLAERMRPRTLSEVEGQPEVVEVLRELTQRHALPSIILWGPPGCGKTTIARLLAGERYEFVQMSAVLAGVKDVREAVESAKQRRRLENRGTLLFLDEIHRFSKSQQDVLLPHVEDGSIVLVGATTENPSFEVVSPLLSRSRVLTLKALAAGDIEELLLRALTDAERGLGLSADAAEPGVLTAIAELAAGDARFALNTLEVAAGLAEKGAQDAGPRITKESLKRAVAGRALHYDKDGEEHYNVVSALHKAVRGSDPDAALYWLARMLESGDDPKFVVRRMIRMASEDIGLADPWALVHAIAAKDAVEFLGMPECNNALAQLAVYLASAPKSNSIYTAYSAARDSVNRHGALPVPLHIRNAPTKLMKELGYGSGYKYAHEFPDGFVPDNYWPDALKEEPPRLLKLTGRGSEKTILERLRRWWGGRFDAGGGVSVPLAKTPDAQDRGVSVPLVDSSGSTSVPLVFDGKAALQITNRSLPHWRLNGSTYFVTWRLAPGAADLSPSERDLVVSAIQHFNNSRYAIYAFVVMNDHAHAVLRPLPGFSLGSILHSWKSYTAHEMTKQGRLGQVWQHDTFDRIIRDEDELEKLCNYILNNPLKRWPDTVTYKWVGIG